MGQGGSRKAGIARKTAANSHLIALEPRMMFDGAAVATAADAVVDASAKLAAADLSMQRADLHDILATEGAIGKATYFGQYNQIDSFFDKGPSGIAGFQFSGGTIERIGADELAVTVDAAPAPVRDVIFIDTSVDGYQDLAAEWANRGEVVLIDSTRDGIDQVLTALAGKSEIGAIHFVTHGGADKFQLGTTIVDNDSIRGSLSAAFASIGSKLSVDGDILIYGCDLNPDDASQGFAKAIADVTGADIALSSDATGAAALGGDWDLEIHQGGIEAFALTSDRYNGLLQLTNSTAYTFAGNVATSVIGGVTTTFTFTNGTTTFSAPAGDTFNNIAAFYDPALQGAASISTVFNATAAGQTAVLTISFSEAVTNPIINLDRLGGSSGGVSNSALFTLTTAGASLTRLSGPAHFLVTATTITRQTGITTTGSESSLTNATGTGAGSVQVNGTFTTLSFTLTPNGAVGGDGFEIGASVNRNPPVVALTGTNLLTNGSFESGFTGWTSNVTSEVSSNPAAYGIPTNPDGKNFIELEGGAGSPTTTPSYVETTVATVAGQTYTVYLQAVNRVNVNTGDRFSVSVGGTAIDSFTTTNTWDSYGVTFTATSATSTLRFTSLGSLSGTGNLAGDGSGTLIDDVRVVATNSAATFTENGAAVSIATANNLAFDGNGSTLASATITLTNAQASDQLLVNGSAAASGTLTGGISYTLTSSSVTLTGVSSEANYAAAIRAIQFNNTSENPNTTQRVINVTVNDGAQGSNTAVARIDVIAVNDTPTIAVPAAYSGNEDINITINGVTLADIDAGNSSVQLTVSIPTGVGVLNWATTPFVTVVQNGTNSIILQGQRSAIQNAINSGALVLAPALNYNGTSVVTFVFNDRGNTGIDPGLTGDATSEQATTTATLTVAAVNDAPVAVGSLPPQSNLDAASVTSVATAAGFSDVDNATLTYSATGLPAGLTINTTTGVISGTINRSASQVSGGVYSVVVTATDAGGLAATQTFSWTVTNPAPTANNDTASTNEDTPIASINVLGNDVDPDGDPLTVTSASAPNGTVLINGDGTLRYTPNANFNGTDTITYTISDGQGGTSTARVTVTVTAVNDAPVASGTLPAQVNVDAASVTSVATAGGFTDVDNASLTYSAAGLPAGLTINTATGVISGTINRSASQVSGGIYSVVVTATDAGGLSATQTFSWTVTNPTPTATNDTASTNEDTPLNNINVLANDVDPDGDPLTVTTASAVNGTVTINANGTLNYTPNANFNGTDTITYTISDGQGGTSTARVTVTVAAVNDAPVATGTIAPQTNLDGTSGVSLSTASKFTDIDNASLTYSAAGLPAGLTINATTGVISGTIDRSASQVGGGAYNVVVTATDAGGLSATQAFTWTVTNPAPTATNDTASTNEDTPVTINVLGNDSDPDGDPLTVVSATATNGAVTINPDGTLRYTPNANFNGTDTITYRISDGQGGFANATVTVTVAAVNDVPTTTGLAPRTNLDAAVVSVPTATAFSDVDGNTLTYSATGLPSGLSINATTGVISGTIDRSASQVAGGVYSVTVTANDGNGGTVSTIFAWTVTNPGPVATNDSASTLEDTPITISVLANDSDPDGDPLTVTSASALNGTVTINANGTLAYTPAANFHGTDTITYEISDGQGGTAMATVTVTVGDVNDPPTSSAIANQTSLDSQNISLPVASAFSDPDGDPLTYGATGLPAGLTINATTGVISGTINHSASQVNGGAYTITVTASDGKGGSVSSTFTWAVANPAPVAMNDNITTNEDTAVVIPVLANDVDSDGDPLTVTAASAGNGSVVINANGTLTYTPNANFNGTDTIIYSITDSEGGTSTATVTITVTPVNDAPTTSGLPGQNDPDAATVSVPTASAFSDLDGDALNFTATGLPPGLTIDPVTGLIAGNLTPGDSNGGPLGDGSYTVTVYATDASGATVSTTFVWLVRNVPPMANDDVSMTNEDTAVTVAVLTNDSDLDGDTLSLTTASATHGTVVINGDNTITFTPDPDFNGIANVTYSITDSRGGVATATVTITVNAVNDAPDSVPLPNETNQDNQTVSRNVGSFFSDKDGDTLSFGATGLPAGLTINPTTGIISGTIDKSASQPSGGVYSVTVTATDPGGLTSSRTFTWTITNPAPTAANDSATTAEDTPVDITVLANDSDPDADPLTVTSATASHGTVTINPDGTLHYVPNANYFGPDTIVYNISDGNGGVSTAAVAVTVTSVNDAPVANNDTATTNEDTPVTLSVLGNDTDVDGDTLTVTAATSPNGTVVINPDGTITFTPNANFNGQTTITYTISDGNGGTSTAMVTVTVDPVNDPPVATNDTAMTNEDAPVTIPVLANDTDVDGNPLTVTSATAPNGTVVINANGTITYTPNANFNGTDTITYQISDGNGGFSTATVTVTVTGVNDAPTATPLASQTSVDAATVSIPTAASFSDLDGDVLSYSATGLPAGLSINASTGVISGTIDRSASQVNGGIYTATVTASDGRGGSVSTTISWTITNPAPTATNDTASTSEDMPVTVSVLANDSDPDGDPLTVTAASAPNGTVVINANGTITYTPNANFNGSDTITYTISDGQGGTATATVTVTVAATNDAPVVDTPLSNRNNADAANISVPTAGNFSDLDGDTLSFSATGLPLGLTINPATGVISGTIDRSASQTNGGIYSVTVTASDGNGGTVSSTFTWTVTNPGPVAANDTAMTPEDTAVVISVLANDSDPDGDPLTVTAASAPNGTVVINANGTITYTPNANFNGTDTITYTISDGQGGTSTATVLVTVSPVNDAPTATPLAAQNDADSAIVSVPTAASFSDLDGNTLSFSATGLPAGLTINAATGVISGTIDHSASQANGGIYSVTVTASDGQGGTVSTVFTWTVTNPAPNAVDDTASTSEDIPVVIPVLANDSDPDGDALTVTTASAPNGVVVINANGTITYTPNANFNGTDTITYTITDSQGGTSTATVTVTVGAVNDPPVVDSPLTNRTGVDGTPVSIPVAGNFSDLDGDTLTFTATGLPAGLSISATGVISGTIDPSASTVNGGSYTVTVTASDGKGGTVSTTFAYTISNPAPTAANDTATTAEDTPISSLNVLGNDTDPDGDTLSVTSAIAAHGTVSINPDGTLNYTPNANFNGTDTITYSITDSQGGVSTATVTVTVTPVNDAPVTVGLPDLFDSNSEFVSINVSAAFSDIDAGNTLSFVATGLPAGLAINPSTGVIFGQISPTASAGGPGNNGVYTVTVTASDGQGGTVSTSYTWTIGNQPPLAADDTFITGEDVAVTMNVLANDTDPDADPNTPIVITNINTTHGTSVINANGTITFTPDANFNGVATVTYTISDGLGGFSTAVATITVVPVNDAPDAPAVFADRTGVDGTSVSLPLGPLFSDIDAGDTLTFSATGLPTGLSINPATGEITGTIDKSASQGNNGVFNVSITATDSNSVNPLSTTRTFAWTISNPGPTAVNDTASTNEDVPVTITPLANDTDPDGDTLSVTAATAPHGTVVINPDNSITYTPDPDFNGTDTITYTISDGQGGTSVATITVTVAPVNDAPVAAPLAPQSNIDGDAVSFGTAANFSDVDGDTLTFSATGLPLGLSIDSVTGVVSGTIDKNASQPNGGVYVVSVTASDGNGGTVTTNFVYTVNNPAPTAVDDTASTNEDSPVTISVLANDTDPDADPLTVTTASAAHGSVVINPDGTITYTPAADFNGTDTISYTISDGNGGTSTASVTVTVNPVNDAPVATPIAPATSLDGSAVSIPVAANFSDLDGDALTFSAAGLPLGLSINPATGVITGTIDKNASQVSGGIYAVTVTASDGNGGMVSTTFAFTVTNPGPTAVDDVASTNEDTPVNIAVLANDTDPDADPLVVLTASAGNGTVVINADGTITYTPNANFNGTDTISYTISDGQGGTSTATVNVTVAPQNDPPVAVNDTASTLEETPVNVSVLANDSDLDGNPLTVTAASAPNGSVVINPDGTITYTPNANFNGTDTVTYTISDGQGGTATATVLIIVAPINDAPVAVNDVAGTPEDQPVRIAPLLNDSDPDGDTLTITAASAPNGTVVINPDGTITFTPNANFNGTDTITYTISDGNGGTATAMITVTVSPVNDPPVAVDDVATTAEDMPVTVTVLTNDSDVDGDPLMVVAATAAHGTVVINANGTVTYTPNANYNGPDVITYTISDGNGGSSTAMVAVTVTPVNDAPVANNDTATTAEDQPVTVPVLGNDTDLDGDTLIVTTATAPNGTVVINADGTITYTPNANFNGTDTITYTISDGNGGTATATVTVTVTPVNDPPVAVNDIAVTNEDAPVTISPLANDTDIDGNPLTVTSANAPNGTVVINANGTITYTPNANFNGTDTITYTISDGQGGFSTATITVTVAPVNDPPVAVNDVTSKSEDAPVTVAVLANDSDLDGNPLTVTAATAPNGTVVINADGTITYTPNANFNGTDTITYTISDGNGGTATATVTVTVTPVNDPPVAVNDVASTNEDTAVVVPVLANDTDIDGNPLTVTAATAPNGTVVINSNGTITYTPNANFNGTDTITYTISDGQGGFSTATITVTVAPVNDPPVAVNDVASTNEDAPVTVAVLANDSDLDGNPLTVTAATAPNGTVVINADGTITYTPNANFNGTDTITYTISDGQGGTSTATVMVTVVPVNDPPVAASDVAATSEDVPVTIPVLANDSDLDGDNLTVTAATAPNGTVVINADGTITYTPNPDFNGTDTITYTVSDGKGGTATATVTVTVAPVNDAPRLMPDTAVVAEDSVVTINVLANDVDVEGDPLTVTAASAPNGTVVINPDGTITYTPNANFNGTDTITYTVSDGMGGVSTTTVTVTVTPVNDPPVAANDSGTINEDTTVRLPVLANDTDLDGDQLTVTSASAPNGTVVINADGTISYTPNANFNGTDTITYSISDGKGGTSTAIATITILPVNDPPIVGPDTATVPEEGSVTINVLANDSDPEGDPLTLTAASAANGTVVINPDGTITYTPRKDFFGVDTITYTVSDGKGGFTTATAAVTVTVSNIQDPPTDGNETISIVDGQTVNIAVLANAVDVDNDPLSVTAATVTIGTLVINPDGTITYTAPFGYEGVATITYTVSDGKGGTVVSTVTINVERQGIDVEQMLRRDDLDARVPDFARIDAGRISDEQFISTPLIVVDTVNSFRSLNGTTDLSVSAPILEAVNGISSLKGVGSFDVDGNPILAEVANLDRIVDFRFGVDRLFDHRFGDFGVKGLTGFSVRQLDTGSDQLMIESVIRDRVIYMETRDIGKQGDSPVKEFQLRMRSGAPLPDWIRFDSRGLAIIERPADADEIRLIVRAIREDGKVIEVPVIIQGATGEIQLDQKLAPKPGHISRAMTLDQAAKLAENAANDGAAKLSAAFSG